LTCEGLKLLVFDRDTTGDDTCLTSFFFFALDRLLGRDSLYDDDDELSSRVSLDVFDRFAPLCFSSNLSTSLFVFSVVFSSLVGTFFIGTSSISICHEESLESRIENF